MSLLLPSTSRRLTLGRPLPRPPSSLPPPPTRCRSLASAPKRPPPPPRRRALVDVGLVVGGCIALAGLTVWARKRSKRSSPEAIVAETEGQTQFSIPVASHTGSSPTKKTLTMLTADETDRVLKKAEATYEVNRPGNPVYRYDTNSVASNSPIEDDSVITVVSRTPPSSSSTSPTGDLLFFGIFDGHSGWTTSKLLAERLVAYVGRELEAVFRGDPEYVAVALGKQLGAKPAKSEMGGGGALEKLWNAVRSRDGTGRMENLDADDDVVAAALRRAFVKMDEDIVQGPVRELTRAEKDGQRPVKDNFGAEMTPEQTKSLQTLLPALSGSCAQLAYFDAARSKVHVATTGDSRAVMGVWEPDPSGKGGKWRAEILSEDQEGTNPKEVDRMRSEHPSSESQNVIQRGRVLGGLQPTRAFGDARYKWPLGVQERLYSYFHPGSGRRPPPNYLTPPYVTAEPVVTTTSIPPPSAPTCRPSPNENGQAQAFVVIATDGLWDRLGNAEVVGLVGTWLEGRKGVVPRRDVVSRVSEIKEAHHSPHTPERESSGRGDDFVFEDENAGTHLIRNAFGGAARHQVSALLSIPAPHARRYRDDVTVTVVMVGEGKPGRPEGVRKVPTRSVAKL